MPSRGSAEPLHHPSFGPVSILKTLVPESDSACRNQSGMNMFLTGTSPAEFGSLNANLTRDFCAKKNEKLKQHSARFYVLPLRSRNGAGPA